MVERPPRVPVPSRIHQRHPARSRPDEDTYIREDQIVPHLATIAIFLAGHEHAGGDPDRASQATSPARAAELVDRLRSSGQTLTYDPRRRTLRADTQDCVAVTIGRSR
jgi:site-specific DNA recombinase